MSKEICMHLPRLAGPLHLNAMLSHAMLMMTMTLIARSCLQHAYQIMNEAYMHRIAPHCTASISYRTEGFHISTVRQPRPTGRVTHENKGKNANTMPPAQRIPHSTTTSPT
jgi:hypothetical protein